MRLLVKARRDLIGIADWYESQRPGLGLKFLLAFRSEVSGLRRLPELHEVVGLNTRRFRLRRFPSFVFYQVEPDGIVVSGLIHKRRDRRTWGDLVLEYHPIHADIVA